MGLFQMASNCSRQETPELVPDGETPQNVAIVVFDDLVNQVRPGDKVQVTGIYRAAPAACTLRLCELHGTRCSGFGAGACAARSTGWAENDDVPIKSVMMLIRPFGLSFTLFLSKAFRQLQKAFPFLFFFKKKVESKINMKSNNSYRYPLW